MVEVHSSSLCNRTRFYFIRVFFSPREAMVRVSTIQILLGLVLLGPACAWANPDSEPKVRAMLTEDVYSGFVEIHPDEFEGEPDDTYYADLREARLIRRKDVLQLHAVASKSRELRFDRALMMSTPGPGGKIRMARWILDDEVVDLVWRTDELLEEEAKVNFGGILKTAPRIYFRVRDRDSQVLVAQGFLHTAAQAGLWRELQELFPRLTVTYRSYASELKAECDEILKTSLIRGR